MTEGRLDTETLNGMKNMLAIVIPDAELSPNHNMVRHRWIPGKPPEDEAVAWLRVLDGGQVKVVLGAVDSNGWNKDSYGWNEDCWCEVGDWNAKTLRDPVSEIITHWMAYDDDTSG